MISVALAAFKGEAYIEAQLRSILPQLSHDDEIIVSDDGTGFDVNEKKDDGRSHVGMENIRRRLQEMCGAEVIINSTIGEGTVATVVLPKEEQHHEDTVR